jgi:hypothetical protein
MSPLRRFGSAPAAVHLCADHAEWLDDAGPAVRYGTAPVEGRGAAALVAAVEGARKAAGAPRRPLVLALQDGLVAFALHAVPPLGRKDLRDVLARKAARALACEPDDAVFAAFAPPSVGAAPGTQEPWCVTALRRAEITALCLRLRDRGFAVRRVVAGRQAALQAALSAAGPTAGATMVVVVGPTALTISLCRGSAVLNQDVIEGDLRANPGLASSLIQQAKSVVGYWRKESRGEHVEELVLFGLYDERALLLKHAFEAALPGVRVRCVPAEVADEDADRYAYLRAARCEGPLCPDLSIPMPPRRRTVAALVALGILGVAGVGATAAVSIRGEARLLGAHARRLDRGSADLDRLRAENAHADQARRELEAELGRLAQIRATGVPVRDVFHAALAAFHGRATLVDLDVRPDPAGGSRVAITGRVGADPATMLAALGELRRALEGSGCFAGISVLLPADLSASGAPAGGELEFLVDGTLAGKA